MTSHRILDWLERAPTPARVSSVAPLVRTLFQPGLAQASREVLDLALTMLLDDPSVEVRRALAEALAREECAPRHLVVALSQDLPVVAEVLYRRSPCLIDGELAAAVAGGGRRIQMAIAARPWISVRIAGAIVAQGDRAAVLVMLANAGADMDGAAFRAAAVRFGGDGEVRQALFARPDLPLAIRQQLVAALGGRLNRLLAERSWLTPARARDVVRDACDRATVRLAGTAAADELVELAGHLRASGQITAALLIRAMCVGDVRFLETVLAELSGLPGRRVYALIAEGRAAALKALFCRAGLPERSHAALAVALEVRRELDEEGGDGDRTRFALRLVERILTRYQQLAPGEVDDLMALLRRLAAEAARERARAVRADLKAGAWSGDAGLRAA